MSTARASLPRISPRAWEHPSDASALAAMRKMPGFDLLVRKFVGLVSERRLRYLFLASAVRVNERQFRDVHRVYTECLEVLDFDHPPELFVAQTPFVNAGAVGTDEPFIVLNSGTLELADEDELRLIIGHELGHILSGHVLLKTMLAMLVRMSVARLGLPLVGLVRFAVVAALLEWDRKSELSSDRAALLCGQDPEVAYRLFMKMAGGRSVGQMDVAEFVAQAEEYEAGGDRISSVLKLLNLSGQRHPFWVLRLAELKRWVEHGDYAQILEGTYPRRDEEAEAPVAEDSEASGEGEPGSERERATENRDPFLSTLREVGAQLAETGSSLLGSLFGWGKGGGARAAEEDDTKEGKDILDDVPRDPGDEAGPSPDAPEDDAR
jgi:Zn-dependent protease with chaperone function